VPYHDRATVAMRFLARAEILEDRRPQKVGMANVEGVLRTTKLGEGYHDARYASASRIESIIRL